MKLLLNGIISLIMATLVSIIVLPLGFVYSLGYSIFMSFKKRDITLFFKFWFKLIDGFAHAIGHALYNLAYALDLSWNVNGELLEDMITSEENTTFSDKEITVSATVGKIELDGKLNKYGKFSSRVLNKVFGQKRHAADSWEYTKFRKELKEKYFD